MEATEKVSRLAGTLEWSDGKDISISALVDRLAVFRDKLMFVSLVAVPQNVKALRAAFAAQLKSPIKLRGIEFLKRGDHDVSVSRIEPHSAGYQLESQRLGYGQVHVLFTARRPGLMLADTDVSLWRELKQPRYTTPLLRGWLPYLRAELLARELLEPCDTLNCECWVLTASTRELDEIVEHGLRGGTIEIKESA